MFRLSRRPGSLLLRAAAVLAVACDGDGSGSPADVVEIVKTANSGDGQTGTVGQALPSPLQVLVTDGGAPTEGVTVAWSTASGGTVIAAGPTGADGISEADWTLGTDAGEQAAQASLQNAAGSPLTFTATAEPGPPARLSKAGGDGQSAPVGTALAEELAAQVGDEFGNGVAGVEVLWSVGSGDATAQPTSDPTDDDGISRTTVTLGTSTGPSLIIANSEGLEGSPVQFTATARLYVFVEDNFFSPADLNIAPGTTVTWAWADAFAPHNVVPDETQPARSGDPVAAPNQYSFTFNTPGTYRYYCEVHGGPDGTGMSGVIQVTP